MKSPARVKKIGHLVFNVSDMERSIKFWTDVMGFSVSDQNERGMVFLRSGPDHHTIGLAETRERRPRKDGELGFNHCAMEVGSIAELFAMRDHLKENGIPIVFEGRRGAGCNVGIQFVDPDGNMIELYVAMDQIGWDGQSRPHDQWRRAKSLEEAVENPVPGVVYD